MYRLTIVKTCSYGQTTDTVDIAATSAEAAVDIAEARYHLSERDYEIIKIELVPTKGK